MINKWRKVRGGQLLRFETDEMMWDLVGKDTAIHVYLKQKWLLIKTGIIGRDQSTSKTLCPQTVCCQNRLQSQKKDV